MAVATLAFVLAGLVLPWLAAELAGHYYQPHILALTHTLTLGWITLSIVASAAWFFRGIDRTLAIALAVLIPIYVAAFYLAIAELRAIVGAILLVAILWLVVWAWRSYGPDRSLPALALALGLTTFTYGAIIGVLRQIQLAGRLAW